MLFVFVYIYFENDKCLKISFVSGYSWQLFCKTCDIKGTALFVWVKNRIFTYASVTVIGFSLRLKEFELFIYKWHSVLITAYKFPLVHAINLFSRETIDKVCYVNSIKSMQSGGRRHYGQN